MKTTKKVAVFVGSLRKESYALKIAKTLIALAPSELKLEVIEIGQLPLYNEDLETKPAPAPWTALRETLEEAYAVLFITPEYNRSVPAVLKNALDVASRPYGFNVFDGKPGAVISSSTGAPGGFGANHHFRQSLMFLNVPLMQQPEAYIGGADKLFDEKGEMVQTSRDFLNKFMQAYSKWVSTILGG